MNTPTIKQAAISQCPWGHCEVVAILEDGNTEKLFTYYPDEISFTEAEFTGMTVDQARALRHQRDVRYLQS